MWKLVCNRFRLRVASLRFISTGSKLTEEEAEAARIEQRFLNSGDPAQGGT